MDIEAYIAKYEDNAIAINDWGRAIKYNWIRNAFITGQLDEYGVLDRLLEIHCTQDVL